MKKLILLSFLALTLQVSAQQNILKQALTILGLDSSNIGFRPQKTWAPTDRTDPFRLRYFDALLARPLTIPNFTRSMLAGYEIWMAADSSNMGGYQASHVRPLAQLIMNSARNLGYDIGRYGFDFNPEVPEHAPLLSVISNVFHEHNVDFGNNIVYPEPTTDWTNTAKKIEAQTTLLPPDLQKALAQLVAAINEAVRWRNQSLAKIPATDWQHIFTNTTLEESQCDAQTFDQKVYDAAIAFDGSSCHYGATLLAQVVEKTLPVLQKYKNESYSFECMTPIGRIVLSGNENTVHYEQDCSLLIDLGGDDVYYGAVGSSSATLPVSVAIDLAGNDLYLDEHEGTPSQGTGVLGIGMLIDLEGNDVYTAKTFSQGCGRFGVGVLYDAKGNDVYNSVGFSQGAGMYGIGILFDKAGNDKYNTVCYAQGYGFSLGLGLLADAAGDDVYTADDTNLTHVGDETPKHNESDAQGYGAGRRADHIDGHSMSGGLGILDDLAGDDKYFAGVFAQGCGYWFGYGILHDHTGDDSYRGVFFNLGAAAHFSIGVLLDDAGNDKSDLVMTLGFSSAHDGSATFYIDADGNDTYTMSQADSNACSLGTALNNSFSLFLNVGGDDVYKPVGHAFGYATSRHSGEWSTYAPSTGLFIDIGGEDTYKHVFGKDNSTWRTDGDGKQAGVRAIGIDVPEGMIKFE